MASTSSVVMSATSTSSRRPLTSAVSRGESDGMTVASRHARPCAGHPRLGHYNMKDVDGRDKPGHDEFTSRPLRVRFGAQVEGAAPAEVVEMRVEEAARRAPAARPQHLEEVVV